MQTVPGHAESRKWLSFQTVKQIRGILLIWNHLPDGKESRRLIQNPYELAVSFSFPFSQQMRHKKIHMTSHPDLSNLAALVPINLKNSLQHELYCSSLRSLNKATKIQLAPHQDDNFIFMGPEYWKWELINGAGRRLDRSRPCNWRRTVLLYKCPRKKPMADAALVPECRHRYQSECCGCFCHFCDICARWLSRSARHSKYQNEKKGEKTKVSLRSWIW